MLRRVCTSGPRVAAVPLLLVKLWSVYPNLFRWPPVRSAQARAGAPLGVRAGRLCSGAASHRFLNTLNWYPLAVVVPIHPSLPGLRADRFHPPAHRDEAARHQVRPPQAKLADANILTEVPWNENPLAHSNAGNGSPAGMPAHGPARSLRRRWLRDREQLCSPQSARPSRRWRRSACSRPERPPKGRKGVPVEQDRQVGAGTHAGQGRRLAPRGGGVPRPSP